MHSEPIIIMFIFLAYSTEIYNFPLQKFLFQRNVFLHETMNIEQLYREVGDIGLFITLVPKVL